MKYIITLTIFILFAHCSFGQVNIISGGFAYGAGNDVSYRVLELRKDSNVVGGALTDAVGMFKIRNIKPGKYALILQNIPGRDRFVDSITVTGDTVLNLTKYLPLKCDYTYTPGQSPVCKEGHSDHIVHIRYGFPNKRMMRLAKRGKIWLGGCVISDCDPKYYCTIHKKPV